jgi:hypothetical protein
MMRCLCAGRDAGKERGLLGGVGELLIGHLLDRVAQEDELRRKADLLADLAATRSLSPVKTLTETP